MKTEIKKLPQSMVEILVELSVEELKPYLEKSAVKISETAKIEGFRPGKAPYNIVKEKFGEMAILQEAIDDIISKTYYQAVVENELVSIGQPKIDIEKIAPENPFSYKATVAVLPKVTLGDFSKIKLKREEIKITDDKVNQVVEEIRKMRSSQEKVDRAAKSGDALKIDFDVYRDGVPIEHGKSQDYPITIGEGKFIPGFEENLVGMKAGDEKEFKLKFPEEYFEKSLAGKPAEFKVKIKEVNEVKLPELTDDFAKEVSGGKYDKVDDMKTGIAENLKEEETAKQEQRLEISLLEEAVKVCEFEELPEVLVHEEIHRMIHELEDSIAMKGLNFDDYLKSIGKTVEELEKGMEPQAELRAKTSILAREIYQQQKFEVTPDEIEKEIAEIASRYPANPDVLKQLNSEMYKDYLKNSLGNKKVIEYLKNLIIK
ncbi:MAG: Trigger factor [Parcubacteria group bacterium ADurb.Bin326]|nr:MAG: Trigger factor [Parcubacteria group bacterium ADurb.Bin326]